MKKEIDALKDIKNKTLGCAIALSAIISTSVWVLSVVF